MKKINFVNGTTIDGASTFNQMQDNVEEVFNGKESMGSIVVEDIECKNLIDTSGCWVGTSAGLTATISDGNIILNGTTSSTVDIYCISSKYNPNILTKLNKELGEYTLSNNLGFANYIKTTSGYKQDTITITETDLLISVFVKVPSGKTFTNEILKVQLELGNEASSYTPHKKFSNKQIYSTNEQIIGTWVDGKTLYRKVINLNMPNGLTERFNEYDTGLNNVTVRKIYGVMYVYGNVFPLPIHNLINGESCLISTQNGGEHINIELNCDYSNYNADIIIEYTK